MREKAIYVKDLKPGSRIVDVFAVERASLAETRTGKIYINAVVIDSTGSVTVRLWDATQERFDAFPAAGEFVLLGGRVDEYNGKNQLIVDDFEAVSSDEVALDAFLPSTSSDIDEMWQELLSRLEAIQDPDYSAMTRAFTENGRYAAAFRRSPAATGVHHAYVGGLLEHTLAMMRAADALLPFYDRINGDLLRIGILLHDMAKIAEYEIKPGFGKTRRGLLLGHIAMGTSLARRLAQDAEAATSRPVPPVKLELVQHLILAHHGQLDYGSPVLPAIPEGWFLHYIDNLDAKLNTAYGAIDSDSDADSDWTPFHRMLGCRVFKRSAE